MKLKKLKSNVTELTFKNHYDDCDVTLLFSYETPVAGYDNNGAFRTDRLYSTTTTRHINKYLGGKGIGRKVTQNYIDSLVN